MSSERASCPYIGLQPYTEAQQEYFFGRDRDVRSICSNLYAAPLTILYGASGVGKSSVLLAGVVPRLRSTPRTAVVMFREWQGPSFLQTLKFECIKAVESANKGPLHLDADLPIDKLLAAASQALGGALLILFDQFEEYSLYHPEADAGNSFDGELARAVNRPETQTHVLLALREDGLSKLDRFRTRIPNLLANRLRLQHLDRRAAEEAIRKPLDVYNNQLPEGKPAVKIEDVLIEAVLDQIGASQISLSEQAGLGSADVRGIKRVEAALLQLVMTRLWKEEQEHQSVVLRRATLDRLEGAKQIVKRHLDEEMEKLSEEERGIASRMFRLLVTSSGSKIAQETDVLASIAECPLDCAKDVLAKLARSHLLNRISDSERYEIFHDVLGPAIKEWQTAWELAEGEKRAALEAAEQARDAARKSEEQRRLKRRQKQTVGLLAVVAVTGTLALLAWTSRNTAEGETHKAHALRLAAIAQTKLSAATQALPADAQTRGARLALPLARALQADAQAGAARLALLLARAAVAETYPKEVLPEAELALRQAVSPATPTSRALAGHKKSVYELTFSRDGKRLATASFDNTVKVWDPSALKELFAIQTTEGQRVRLAFNTDGTHLGTLAEKHLLHRWDTASGKELVTTSSSEGASAEFSFGKDIKGLTVDSTRGAVNVRDTATGRILFAFPTTPYDVSLIASSQDGKLLAVGGDDGAVTVLNTYARNELARLSGHTGRVFRAAFSADGNCLATVGADGYVIVWDIQSRQQLYRSPAPPGASGLVLNSNGARMAIGDSKGQVTIVTLKSDELIAQAAALSPDGAHVVLAGQDGTLNVLNRSSGEELLTIPGPPVKILTASVSLDGKRLAASISASSVKATANAASTSASSVTNLVKVWELSSGREVASLPPFSCPVQAVAFNADGTSLTTAAASTTPPCTGELKTWNISSGKELGPVLDIHSQGYRLIALSSDSTRFAAIASGYGGNVLVREIPSGQELGQVPDIVGNVYRLALSTSGVRLAVASLNGTIRVWDTSFPTDPKPMSILPRNPKDILAITFSADLKRLATVAPDGSVRDDSLDIQETLQLAAQQAAKSNLTFKECGDYKVHTDHCEAVELDNEGRALARDGKLWRAATKFKRANKLDDKVSYDPDPKTVAKRLFAQSLRDDAAKLARDGHLEEATKKYEEAKSLDHTSKIDPQDEPKRLLAEIRLSEGKKMAIDGDLAGAKRKYQEAKSLNPSFVIRPQDEPEQLLAKKRVQEGRNLARDGSLAEATKKFQEALSLNPSLRFDPEQEVKKIVLESRVSKALELAEQGKIKESLSAFLDVQKQDPTKIAGEDWNALCWQGSLWGHPRLVVNDACDKAVKLSRGTIANSRDSRGLARALTSDAKGAIEDFQYYVKHADDPDRKLERQGWIAALQQGSNPFTPEVLKTLFSQ